MYKPPRSVKFVESDPNRGGLPVKRKQVQQACELCRRKKRRCFHAPDNDNDGLASGERTADHHSSPDISPAMHLASTSAVSQPSPTLSRRSNGSAQSHSREAAHTWQGSPGSADATASQTQPSRFIGDLNPEGIFLEAARPPSFCELSQKDDVGIWLSVDGPPTGLGQASQFVASRPPLVVDQILLPLVKEKFLACLPPPAEYSKLEAIFFRKIHPIFPILGDQKLNDADDTPSSIVLRQLICLAAGTDLDASSCLRLNTSGSRLMKPQEFSHALSSAIRIALYTSIITDRLLHIRALTLLSLYIQPTCAEEADLPASLAVMAVHHVQTLGLHLLRYDAPNCDELETMFCAVWALDRMTGAIYGRPVLIHERDVGADLQACIRRQRPCFRLLLSVVHWLDEVTELYRPGPSAAVSTMRDVEYIDLPVLEGMVADAGALQVPSQLIATIETLYHAVIILSCRLTRPGTASAASTLPPPSANARRSLAAERIACAVPRDRLSPFPFVPYAVSLALSVEYRKMRHSRLPMFRARAMNAFKRNCEMLRAFADHFWSANVVAGLGERVLKEMERAATSLQKDVGSPGDTSRRISMQLDHKTGERQPDVPATLDQCAIGPVTDVDNMVDFSLIDATSGQDIFGHIDPSFNLTAVENALEANLDIGLPLNWGDWGQFAT